MRLRTLSRAAVFVLLLLLPSLAAVGLRGAARDPAAERGRLLLAEHPYGRAVFNPVVLEKIWTVWEPDWKARVKPDDPESLRRVMWERYGWSPMPGRSDGVPMQFVGTANGWVPSCLQCHGGRLPGSGESMIGLPNTDLDAATFAEDLARSFGMQTDQSRLGRTRGRTNAFVFAIELLRMREPDLSMRTTPVDMGKYQSADIDAIPWWYLRKKTRLYADGGITGDFVRPIMQFALAGPTGDQIRSWEPEFVDILAYLRSIEPPRYPWPIDPAAAAAGRKVFERTCAPCHGTYGDGAEYPNRVVPLEQVGTDPIRITAVTPEMRRYYNRTWFGEKAHAEENAVGYIAPPLDGVWASAPYFHNGSVPTVYGVLSPESRPKFYRRVGAPREYDTRDLGFKVEVFDAPPAAGLPAEARRRVTDTTLPGLSNQGHPFAAHLSETEKRQVIEYHKGL
jgi:mono/diheme cytochrome c family protein